MNHDIPQLADARAFAVERHGEQLYGDGPYYQHLDAVALLLAPYGHCAQVVGYLHDVVEDTGTTIDSVRSHFGDTVARCIALLTDEPGPSRKERKTKTYAKLAAVYGSLELALVVKVADRLANVRECVAGGNERLLDIYRGEHAVFRAAAYREGLCDTMWGELDRLLVVSEVP